MTGPITATGELAGPSQYHETPSGKAAVLPVTVMTRHRDPESGDWVTDPPVTYQIVVTGDESLAVAASLAPGDLVLFSGTLRDDTSAVIDAESIEPAVHFRRR